MQLLGCSQWNKHCGMHHFASVSAFQTSITRSKWQQRKLHVYPQLHRYSAFRVYGHSLPPFGRELCKAVTKWTRNKYLNISEPITYLIYHLQHCFLRPSVCVSIVHRYIHPIWKDLCEQLPCQSSTRPYPKADELQDWHFWSRVLVEMPAAWH